MINVRLYLITSLSKDNHNPAQIDNLDQIEEALKLGIDTIQLREKNISSLEYLRRAELLRALTKRYATTLIINDRIDIAVLSKADGVHLGGDDIPVIKAREFLGKGFIIGATAKTVEQAVKAQQDGADYIGTGAWFPSSTKLDALPIDPAVYQAILKSTTLPNVAVGGITADNCHYPLELGASGIAVSKGILDSSNLAQTIQKMRLGDAKL